MSQEKPSSSSTGWYVGIIVAVALCVIAYLVFMANSQQKSAKTAMIAPGVVEQPALA